MRFNTFISVFLVVFTFYSHNAISQSGCTDQQANNFDPDAVENDGSCEYRNTNYTPICLEKMPDELPGCSGFEFFDNQLWAHNDHIDGPQIYQIDTATGEVIKSVWIDNWPKRDWEDMTSSDTHLYIGDFGNNNGNRTDLKVLKIKRSDLTEDTVAAEEINFNFADQTDFSTRNREHDFDCEAILYKNDSLYIFSKNWVDNKTRLYVLPDQAGSHSLIPRAEFDVGGLVTAADISLDGKNILLLCYAENGATFLYLLFDYQDFMPFSGNKRKIDIGSFFTVSQVESLTFQNDSEGFIGSEDFSVISGKLLHFKISQWIENWPVNSTNIVQNDNIHVYPNPFKEELHVGVKSGNKKIKKIEFFDTSGQRVLKKRIRLKKNIHISGNKLSSGMYVMKIKMKDGSEVVKKIIKE